MLFRSLAAKLLQLPDHIDHPGIAQIRAVLLKGETQHQHPGVGDGVARFDRLFNQLGGDVRPYAIVHPATGQDDFRVIANGLRFVRQIVRVRNVSTPMQCPPTRPGLNGIKFHLVPAAASTSWVSIPSRPKIIDSSFISAMSNHGGCSQTGDRFEISPFFTGKTDLSRVQKNLSRRFSTLKPASDYARKYLEFFAH